MSKNGQRYDREFALAAGRIAASALDSHAAKLAYVGSFRRGLPTLGDLDILVIPKDPEAVCNDAFMAVCKDERLESEGSGLSVADVMFDGTYVPINVFYTKPEEWGAALMYTTGSRQYNIQYRSIAHQRGMLVNQYGVFDSKSGKLIPDSGYSERAVCKTIGIPWKPPCEREYKPLPTWCIDHLVYDFCKRERFLERLKRVKEKIHDERA